MARRSFGPGSPHGGRGGEVVDAKQAPSRMRKARCRWWRSDRVSREHHDAPDIGFVAGVDGAPGAAVVEGAQDPASVALDEEPDDGLLAAPGVLNRTRASMRSPAAYVPRTRASAPPASPRPRARSEGPAPRRACPQRRAQIARWYCRESHTTFSLLPDCLAARLLGELDEVEEVVAHAEQARRPDAVRTCLGSSTPRDSDPTRHIGASDAAFGHDKSLGTPNVRPLRCSIARTRPCQRLTSILTNGGPWTRGGGGRLPSPSCRTSTG